MMISDAARQNEEAVVHLMAGDYEEAKLVCRDLMEHMRAAALVGGENPAEESVELRLSSVELPHASRNLASDDDTVAVYKRGMLLSASDEGRATRNQTMFIEATCLFNLGLCHHLQALQDPTSQAARLQGSLNVYSVAFAMLLAVPNNPDHGDVTLLAMAIMNNMAHIYGTFWDLGGVSVCVETMNTLFRACALSAAGVGEEMLLLAATSNHLVGKFFAACPAA